MEPTRDILIVDDDRQVRDVHHQRRSPDRRQSPGCGRRDQHHRAEDLQHVAQPERDERRARVDLIDARLELARKLDDVALWRPAAGSALEGTPNKFVLLK